ncbi:HAD family hydrolase [uncultured Parolsenella sp.]|uniref:HAD family hydrolase n=1 Tax=uncultured Parolsenella sp. TaxID=2083008 RepID=UPI0027DB64AD|nr:HAD family hydrolase [uncultured Parolsenella sp.]
MATGLEGNIRLVATDLDGTLLIGGRDWVRKEAFPLIERVCDAGVLFLAASGRQYASLRTLFAPVADRIGYLCENGGEVIWQGETLVRHIMPRELAMDICHLVEQTPGAGYILSGERHSYGSSRNMALIEHMRNDKGYDIRAVDRPEDANEPIIKVSFTVKPSRNEETRSMFEGCFGEQCEVVTSGAEWVDVIMRGVNKGTAIRELGEVLDIPTADMAAFGDAENDRQMLECVGHPYLMDPCFDSMLDLAPRCLRVTSVEGELKRLLG